jgi:hypothetical protein
VEEEERVLSFWAVVGVVRSAARATCSASDFMVMVVVVVGVEKIKLGI